MKRARSMSLTATPTTLATRGTASTTLGASVAVSIETVTTPTQLSSARVSWTAGIPAAARLVITE